MSGFQSSALLLHLLDVNEDQVYVTDFGTLEVVECNGGACRTLGYSGEDPIGLPLWAFDPAFPRYLSPEQGREASWQTDVTTTVRGRHWRKDGTVFPVEIRGRMVMIDGHPFRIAICRDLSEQRKAERKLEESQRQLGLVIRNLPGVVYRYELAVPGRVLWLDDRVEALTGYPAEEFRSGRRDLPGLIAAEDRSRVGSMLSELAASGGGTADFTYRIVHASSAIRTMRDSVTVAPATGEVAAIVEGMAVDVTERVEQERLLREAWLAEHERYERVVAASGQIVYEWDVANETIGFGGSLREVLGYTELEHHHSAEDALERIHPDDRERVREQVRQSASTVGRTQLEYRHRHADGGYRWVRDHAVHERDASGRVIRATGVLQDITQRKQLEEQLSSAQRMETIGALAGGVAHDVNNYLTAILGNVDLALMRLGDRAEWPELQDARDAAAGCAELVRSLLTFARQQSSVRTQVELGRVAKESLRTLKPLAGPAVVMETDIRDSCPPIEADHVQVQQVILNLVANAVDAMEGRGAITIGATGVFAAHPQSGEPGEFAQFWVQDTGPGVPAGIRDRIFEPYFTTREVGGGTGLGLSIVHGIAQAHGGWAEVSPSEAGARISVFFPAA